MELNFILLFMIFSSLVALGAKDLISSVVALSGVGLGLCLAFLVLKAPNLAVTQLVVEILCVIILIRSTINKDLPLVKDGRWFFNTVSTLFAIVCVLLFSFFALKELPAFGAPIMQKGQAYISACLGEQHFSNIVNAITGHFRRLDALAEMAILFAAIAGVLVIATKQDKKI